MKHYCSRKFPPHQSNIDSISYISKVVLRDTTIFIYIPSDSIFDTIFQDTLSESFKSVLSLSFSSSFAFWDGFKLIHNLTQKDTLIETLLKNAINEHSTITYKDQVIIKTVQTNSLTKWQNFQISAAWILLIILLLNLLWKKLLSGLFSNLMQIFKKKKPP